MYNKLQWGIVWVKMWGLDGQKQVPWDMPIKAKVCEEWSVWKEKDSKSWTVTHNPSGLRVASYEKKRIAEKKAILFAVRMKLHWNGDVKEVYTDFLEELRVLKDLNYKE